MQPPSQMRPPAAPPQATTSPWTPEMIAQCSQDTGYSPQQVQADIARTGASSPEELYPQIYAQGGGIMPQGAPAGAGVVQGGAPPPMAADSSQEEAAEPPQSAPQEAAEGEGLPPEGVAAMQLAMKKSHGPMHKRRAPPPPMRRD